MMLSNCAASVSRPDGAHADLVHLRGRRGLGADLAGGDLHVLLLQGGDHVGGGQPARRQPDRIEPQAHGVLALAEDLHVGDALDALDRVLDVDVDVVADELVVVAIALAVEAGRQDERAGHLVDGDAGVLDLVGQASHHALHAVLHIDGGQVERPGQLEGDVDGAAAVVAAGGGHVAHALHAVDGLFQDGGDGRFDRGGVCAGVERH